jgi:hypothetical protein
MGTTRNKAVLAFFTDKGGPRAVVPSSAKTCNMPLGFTLSGTGIL